MMIPYPFMIYPVLNLPNSNILRPPLVCDILNSMINFGKPPEEQVSISGLPAAATDIIFDFELNFYFNIFSIVEYLIPNIIKNMLIFLSSYKIISISPFPNMGRIINTNTSCKPSKNVFIVRPPILLLRRALSLCNRQNLSHAQTLHNQNIL